MSIYIDKSARKFVQASLDLQAVFFEISHLNNSKMPLTERLRTLKRKISEYNSPSTYEIHNKLYMCECTGDTSFITKDEEGGPFLPGLTEREISYVYWRAIRRWAYYNALFYIVAPGAVILLIWICDLIFN